MAEVMIGIDPHKGSHTAVAIGAGEEPLGQLRVRTCPSQAGKLLAWAVAWPERTWAVEGAAGLGHLLAQQLVADGERVLDVPPKLASRVRLLQAGDINKNDPNDARSVAVAALRSRPPPGDRRGFCGGAEDMVQAAPGPGPGPQPGRLPAARRAAAWSPAVTRRRSPQPRPPESWGRSRHRGPSRPPAPSWPPSSWPTCAAWMPSCAAPARAGRRGPGLRHHRYPPLRRRPGDRRHHHRRCPRVPLPQPGSLRRRQRHRPG